MKRSFLTALAISTGIMGAGLLSSANVAADSREHIEVVGSSTVYPFATVVAERFGKTTSFKTPKIESTGSGGGFKMFCEGVGVGTPDITNASRAIKSTEVELCKSNGVEEIVEVKIGYDGIVIANSRDAKLFQLERKDIFLALAKEVPDPKGGENLVPNPYKTWKQVNSDLPDVAIEVLGPPPTSGTRDAFAELAMEGGCKKIGWIKDMKAVDKKRYKSVCHSVREDGAYIEAGENDNLIVQKLQVNQNALGIFGYSFLEQNSDVVKGSMVEGVIPDFDSIADGSYPVSRPLFFYVKKAHVGKVPGIEEYLAEFTSKKAMGEEGYLSERGLIPLPADEYKEVVDNVKNLKPL